MGNLNGPQKQFCTSQKKGGHTAFVWLAYSFLMSHKEKKRPALFTSNAHPAEVMLALGALYVVATSILLDANVAFGTLHGGKKIWHNL